MLKAAPRAFKWKLPSAPAVCQKRLLFSQSVLRSPLDRSRIPRSIQRLRLQREQEQPAEDPKQTLYPDAIYSPDGSYSGGLIHNSDAVAELLSRPSLVIQRNIEFMNLFLGFEQANRYNILSTEGEFLGRIEEEDYSILKMIMRQVYRLHRPFLTRVYDREDRHILTIQRPFSFINSRIKAILPGVSSEGEGVIVGETRQQWHLWRRKYNLFLSDTTVPPGEEPVFNQFGACDAPFLSFAFPIENEEGKVIAQVDRNWVGLAREFFTDTGVYVLRMEPSALQDTVAPEWIGDGLSLDERVVLLANAISIDFDYFSRHSRGGGGWFSVGDWE